MNTKQRFIRHHSLIERKPLSREVASRFDMKRIAVFDNIKFFLIILVIYGHLSNIGCIVPWPIYNIIYSFHMPLFVFISGYFSKKQDPKFPRTILNLFLLYLIFCGISWLVDYVVYHKQVLLSFYQTPFALWYLLCLIYWKAFLHFIPLAVLKSIKFLIIVLIVSFFPFVIELDYFSFSRFLSFLPFFIVGWLAKENEWIGKFESYLKKTHREVKGMAIICCFSAVCCGIALIIPSNIYWGLHHVELPFSYVLFYRVLALIIAAVNSTALYIVMPKKKGIEEGQYTLFYYLFHTVLLFPVFDLICDHLPNTILTSFGVLGCILLSLFLLRKISCLNKLMSIGKV